MSLARCIDMIDPITLEDFSELDQAEQDNIIQLDEGTGDKKFCFKSSSLYQLILDAQQRGIRPLNPMTRNPLTDNDIRKVMRIHVPFHISSPVFGITRDVLEQYPIPETYINTIRNLRQRREYSSHTNERMANAIDLQLRLMEESLLELMDAYFNSTITESQFRTELIAQADDAFTRIEPYDVYWDNFHLAYVEDEFSSSSRDARDLEYELFQWLN